MLWDSIMFFYIKYVFGGRYAGVEYIATIDQLGNNILSTSRIKVIDFDGSGVLGGVSVSLTLGNYLSLVATIITIVSIVIFCIIIIKKIFSICFNLFTGRSIF